MAEESKITKGQTIADILRIKPKAAAVLMSRGMHCLGCVIAQGETLEQAAEVHGIPIDELLEAINKG
ncbi:MAG: hybrid cluster protein-associated redox disulfide domain-containing protein [Candidatus Saganbacteria bacterium]|uniref:Hybrid cluster protein-associated redox disulfide domain-containing protein n=1 Tax=Candidatus Saganbacteria bacterium TaxID=2575572 RepID=A0A833NYT0_UNCSA|nr:MAG: hybrid cluster protein-associated redox disulfide domain-containing protein [Candidatus Saganbacteria bacterium]